MTKNVIEGKKGFQPVVEQPRRNTQVALTVELLDQLAEEAQARGLSRNLLMEQLLREQLGMAPARGT